MIFVPLNFFQLLLSGELIILLSLGKGEIFIIRTSVCPFSFYSLVCSIFFSNFFSLYLPKIVADLSSFLNFFEFWLFPGNQSYCVLLIVMSLFHTRPVSLPGPVWRDGTLLYYLPKNFSQIYIVLRRMGVKNWMVHYRYYSLASEPLQANGTLLNRILRFDATHTPVQPSRFIEPSISCSTFNDQTSQFDWTTFTTALTVISTNKRAFIRVSTFGASLYTTASDWSWWWSSPQVSEGRLSAV